MVRSGYFKRKYGRRKVTKIPFEPAEYYDKRFKENTKLFRSPKSIRRNDDFLKMLEGKYIPCVFEFAGGSGKLAEMFCEAHPECHNYFTTDFSEEAIKLAKKYTIDFAPITCDVIDITKDLSLLRLPKWNLIICTSMEHIPRDDCERIIEAIPSGTACLFAGADFDIEWSKSHCHVHKNLQYCKDFYGKYIDIKDIHYQPDYRSYAIMGVKK